MLTMDMDNFRSVGNVRQTRLDKKICNENIPYFVDKAIYKYSKKLWISE